MAKYINDRGERRDSLNYLSYGYMQQNLTLAIVGGLGTMFGWGFADFSAKRTFDGVSTLASLVWAHLFGTFVLLLLVIFSLFGHFTSLNVPQNINSWITVAFFGSLQMIIYWLFYDALDKGKASIIAPIFSTYSGIVAVISLLFFGEALSGHKLIALIIIFSGTLLMNIDPIALQKKKKINIVTVPGFKQVTLATLLASFWLLGWNNFIKGVDWLSYTFFMYAFMTLTAAIIARFRKTNLHVANKKIWYFLFLVGLGESLAYMTLSLGFSTIYYTSIVAMIAGASAFPTIILSRIFLKEKIAKLQLIGALSTIAGIVIIAQ